MNKKGGYLYSLQGHKMGCPILERGFGKKPDRSIFQTRMLLEREELLGGSTRGNKEGTEKKLGTVVIWGKTLLLWGEGMEKGGEIWLSEGGGGGPVQRRGEGER